MHYSFDIDLATKYGDREAILLQNFFYWIAKNAANGKNYHDGRYWTYNSVAALGLLFPFWTTSQIRTILASLIKQGCLIEGNYNEQKYDRTKWYALGDEIDKCICQFVQMGSGNGENPFANFDKPIPNSKPNNKTYNIENSAQGAQSRPFDFKDALRKMGVSEQHASDWMAVRKAKRMTNTRTAFDRLKAHIEKACKQYNITPDDCVAFAASKDWGGFDSGWEAIKDITKNNALDEDDRVRRAYAAAEAKFKGDVHF